MPLDSERQTRLWTQSVQVNTMHMDPKTHPDESDNEPSLGAMLAFVPGRLVERLVRVQPIDANDDIRRRKFEAEGCSLEIGGHWVRFRATCHRVWSGFWRRIHVRDRFCRAQRQSVPATDHEVSLQHILPDSLQ